MSNSGYSLLVPNVDDPSRSSAGAACASNIGGGALMDVTTFDSEGGEAVVPMTAGSDGTVVWAYAFDGITAGVNTSNTTATSSSLPLSYETTAPKTTTSDTVSSKSTSSSSPSTSLSSANRMYLLVDGFTSIICLHNARVLDVHL